MKLTIDEALVQRAHSLGPLLREHAAEAEQERRLSRTIVQALEQAGLTKMFMPKTLGGLETDPVTFMRVIEEIASFDPAAAWLLMVSNSGAWFFARMPDATVEELFGDRDNWITATAFQPPVEAKEVPGGYELTGRRPFASAVHAARWACLTAMVMDGEKPRMVNGQPEALCCVMPVEDVTIVDTWYGLGLRGSDSNDVEVRGRFVPRARTCPLAAQFEPGKYFKSPLYRLPAMGAIVLAAFPPIAVAIARNAIEAVRALSAKRVPMASAVPLRERGVAQARFGRAEGMLRSARTLMYDAISEVWGRTRAGEPSTLEQRADLVLAAAHATQTSVEVTDMMFVSGGSSAVFESHPLQRLFRDSQVLRQHGFVCASRYETFAQVALGLEPDLPFVHF